MTRSLTCLLVLALMLQASPAHAGTRLRLNELTSQDSVAGTALKQFKRQVEQGTHGAVGIELNFNGALGNSSDSLEKMIAGDLDLFSGNFEIFLPLLVDEVSGLELPFMVTGNEAAARYMTSPFMEEGRVRDLTLRHIRFLELEAYRAPSRVMASVAPIKSLDALKGLRLAILPTPSKSDIKVWQGLGVSVVELDQGGLKAALEKHEIDAVVVPDAADLTAAGIGNLVPHTGPINDRPEIWQISIHEATWQKLTPEQQKVIAQAAKAAASTYQSLQEQRFKSLTAKLSGSRFGRDINIDAVAAHRALQPVYERLIKVGGSTDKAREAANAAIGPAAAVPATPVQAAQKPVDAGTFPVGPGKEFRDCPECPVMVVIPPGEFLMGSPATEKGRVETEGPQHRVVVSRAFAMAKYPTTVSELKAWRPEDVAQDDIENDPAVMLNWFDGVAYAEWLSKKTGHHYHLPTEAQYEYAQRGGTTTPYYWGETIGVGHANCFGCGTRWDGRGSAPVGSFPPNPYGLYDMAGNIFEWLADCFGDTEEGIPADAFIPHESPDGKCELRAVKGTSWFNLPSFLRSAYRYGDHPDRRNARKGFRMARD